MQAQFHSSTARPVVGSIIRSTGSGHLMRVVEVTGPDSYVVQTLGSHAHGVFTPAKRVNTYEATGKLWDIGEGRRRYEVYTKPRHEPRLLSIAERWRKLRREAKWAFAPGHVHFCLARLNPEDDSLPIWRTNPRGGQYFHVTRGTAPLKGWPL